MALAANASGRIVARIGRLVWATVRDLFADSGAQWAAAIAYYAVLCLFPLLLAWASLAAAFVNPDWAIAKATALLGEFLPKGEDMVRRIVDDAAHLRRSVGFVSVAVLLFLGSRVFGTLARAINIAYGVSEHHGFWRRLRIQVTMLLAVGALLLGAARSESLLQLLWDLLRILPAETGLLFRVATHLFPAVLLLAAFFLMYQFVPAGRCCWRSNLAGAAVATLLFACARPLFFEYVERIADYGVVYGGLAAAVVLLVWAWIVAFITLFGGEFASHLEVSSRTGSCRLAPRDPSGSNRTAAL